MYDVFISYSRRDATLVKILASRLNREAGLSVWFDRARLTPGHSWRGEIEAALNSVTAALIVWGTGGLGSVQLQERDLAYVIRDARRDFRLVHVFLPGSQPPEGSWANVDTWVRFEESLDEKDAFDALVAAVKGQATNQQLAADLPDEPAPYRGLASYRAMDARFFFGRSEDSAAMVDKLRRYPFLAVVGPSGCGKTSLVQAGLLPRLSELSTVSEPDDWTCILVRPGMRPLRALAASLARLEPPGGRLAALERAEKALGEDPARLGSLLDSLLDPSRPMILFVDRFEEVFSLCGAPAERRSFLEAILSVTSPWREHRWLVSTMRADFYGEVGYYPNLAQQLIEHQIYLKPLVADDVVEVIEAPAAQVGAIFEKGLAYQIRMDAEGSGEIVLPFLQHTLELLWKKRRGRWLTWDVYREIGGIAGALRYHADGVIRAFSEPEAQIARRLLTSLVWLGEFGHVVSARRVSKSALIDQFPDTAAAETVLQRLADDRLVVVREEEGEAATELVHDTLPVHWLQLRDWIDADRAFLHWRQRLRASELEWRRMNQDPGSLLHGSALIEAERWLADRPGDISAADKGFVEKGLAQRDGELRARDLRRRRILASVTVSLVITLVLATLLAWQWRHAERQTRAALARQWAAEAQMLEHDQPNQLQRVVLLALESWRMLPSRQAYQVLHRNLALLPRRVAEFVRGQRVHTLRFSPDGHTLVSAGEDGSAAVWEVATGREIVRLPHLNVNLALFDPPGRRIVTAGDDHRARIWKADTGELVQELRHADKVVDAAFSPDGLSLATASHDQTAKLWKVETGELVETFPLERWVTAVLFSPDGRYLAIGSGDIIEVWADNLQNWQSALGGPSVPDRLAKEKPGGVLVWDLQESRKVASLVHGLGVNGVAFSPDGRYLATAGADRIARTWELTSGEQVASVVHEDSVAAVAFSPRGNYVVSISAPAMVETSATNSAKAWDPSTGQELARFVSTEPLYSVDVSPTGRFFIAGSGDGTARVFEPLRQREVARVSLEKSALAVDFGSEEGLVAASGTHGQVSVWEFSNGAADLGLALNWSPKQFQLSPRGRHIVVELPEKTVQLWEVGAKKASVKMVSDSEIVRQTFSADGGYLATTHRDGTARLWDAARGHELARQRMENGNGFAVPSVGGLKWAVTVEDESSVTILDARRSEAAPFVVRHHAPMGAATFSPDGARLATASADGTLRISDARDGRQLVTISHGTPIFWVSFSPFQTLIALSTNEGVFVHDASDGRVIDHIPQSWPVFAAAFSPDERYLAFPLRNKLRLWDRVQGRELAQIPHPADVYQVAFTADGRYIVTAAGEIFSRQHTIQRWRWSPDDLISLACQRLTRNLKLGEWESTMGEATYRRTCPNLPVDPDDALQYASSLAGEGQVHRAGAAFERAVAWATGAEDASASNRVCWVGSLNGFAAEVLTACEFAVRSGPAEKQPFFRDSRGLARALTGNWTGAIEDFSVFIGALQQNAAAKTEVERREVWVEKLKSGQNPFDEETLHSLARE